MVPPLKTVRTGSDMVDSIRRPLGRVGGDTISSESFLIKIEALK
jgi:hypothetical protein